MASVTGFPHTILCWNPVIAKTHTLPLRYLPSAWENTVQTVCLRWKGTRYKHNGKTRGRSVDCLHFAAGVLDELFGTEHSRDLQSLPPDACVHNREGVRIAVRALLSTYPCRRIRDMSVEAGDLVIVGRTGPEHLMVASKRGVLWEASPPNVRMTGYGLPDSYSLIAVYRAKEKEVWKC